MKTLISCFVITMLWTGVEPAAAVPDAPGPPSERTRLDLESFDQVWTTIRDTHWDPDLGGLDWTAVRDELRPKVAAAPDARAARAVLMEMLARLGQSHFGIISGDVYADLGDAFAPEDPGPADAAPEADDRGHALAGSGEGGQAEADGSSGIHLRLIDGVATVYSVDPGSPARRAGVQPGWTVAAVNGQDLASLVERATGAGDALAGSELLLVSALNARLQGAAGESISLRCVDGEGNEHQLALELRPPTVHRVRLGHLPPITNTFEWRLLPSGVGYVAFSSFLDPGALMTEYAAALRSFIDTGARGVVIDLRGNPGGIGAMAMGMAGWLVQSSGQQLGTMKTRDTSLNFVVFPRAETFDGPVAVLVDELSASTSEILAGGLQDLGRATVFGRRSAGMALPSRVDRLPNGDGFQYAFADYVTASGEHLEGRGVIPDVAVATTRADLVAGRDPVLDAAQEWISNHENQNAKPKNQAAAAAH